jgi:hypothetical protein
VTVGGEVRSARWDSVPVRHDPDNDPDNDPGSDAAPLLTGESPFGGQLALTSDLTLGSINVGNNRNLVVVNEPKTLNTTSEVLSTSEPALSRQQVEVTTTRT